MHNPSKSLTPLLEVAVFSYHGARIAEEAGADRIELCENPHDGGTTPSYGYLRQVKEAIQIPVFPIIRPRGGDFLYSEEEWNMVVQDIRICKELGFPGIVTGSLTAAAAVDVEQLQRAVDVAYPMQVTFHRAFDRVAKPELSLEQIINCGCSRILTSGCKPTAPEGKELIRRLVQQAGDRIIIMPGSGVRSSNLHELLQHTNAPEYHSSARITVPSDMQYVSPDFKEDAGRMLVNAEEIRQMKSALLGASLE
ncbi:MAG: copper homeostasis protein CutC [Chitinophagaceae bacterium]|jgi:copper homeostasis protein|nr:copper homeostasis protein CutC [Chitinophagaceae bacterium]